MNLIFFLLSTTTLIVLTLDEHSFLFFFIVLDNLSTASHRGAFELVIVYNRLDCRLQSNLRFPKA